jgi:hypothetical protein
MRPVLLAALDRFVGNEPGVAAAPDARGSRSPASDVGLILIADADRLAIDGRLSGRREVEHELVAIVNEATAVDRFVMTDRKVIFEVGARTGERFLDGDRFDPVNRVLQPQIRRNSDSECRGCRVET